MVNPVRALRAAKATAPLAGLERASVTKPISRLEFEAHFDSTFKDEILGKERGGRLGGGNDDIEIGLAVSGGVDSMALARLCGRLWMKSESWTRQLRFRAFIVDHSARSGSATEANLVAAVLRRETNMPATVLKIKWPSGQNPSQLSNFESLARKYRFQILGKACRTHGIKYICMAHHEDDQAETLLMRMCRSTKEVALTGIKPIANFPECFGLHGLHASGDFDDYQQTSVQVAEKDKAGISKHSAVAATKTMSRKRKAEAIEHATLPMSKVSLLIDENAVRGACQARLDQISLLGDSQDSKASRELQATTESASATSIGIGRPSSPEKISPLEDFPSSKYLIPASDATLASSASETTVQRPLSTAGQTARLRAHVDLHAADTSRQTDEITTAAKGRDQVLRMVKTTREESLSALKQVKDFLIDTAVKTLQLPPLDKENRKAFHIISGQLGTTKLSQSSQYDGRKSVTITREPHTRAYDARDFATLITRAFLFNPEIAISWSAEMLQLAGKPRSSRMSSSIIESGGIKLLRPLLAFSKQTLITTCKVKKMQWFDDATNRDPKLTTRNAIRHLFMHYKLPEALQKDRLLRLMSAVRGHVASVDALAAKQVSQLQAVDFNPHVGSLRVRFCKQPPPEMTESRADLSPTKKSSLAALRAVFESVSGQEHVDVASLEAARNTMCPHFGSNNKTEGSYPLDKPFTVAGVMVRKHQCSSGDRDPSHINPEQVLYPPESHEWYLTAQPPTKRDRNGGQDLVYPPEDADESETYGGSSAPSEKWQLWNGRFWFNIVNHSKDTIVVCFSSIKSMQQLLSKHKDASEKRAVKKRVEQRLKDDNMGSVSHLPAIVRVMSDGSHDVLSFPTLGADCPGIENFVSYQFRYKMLHPWVSAALDVQGKTPAAKDSV